MISSYKKELAHALNLIFQKYSPFKSTIANVVLRQSSWNFREIKFISHHYFAYFVLRQSSGNRLQLNLKEILER